MSSPKCMHFLWLGLQLSFRNTR